MTNEQSQVFFNPDDDTEMVRASELARASFRYFWRELSWERRRITPALDLAAVKIEFTDEEPLQLGALPPVEHMWVSDVDFDGYFVAGRLMNQPNWVRGVRTGDLVRVPLTQIDDWMYSRFDRAYGGFTVNLMRSRMAPLELHGHDDGWGLEFGDPADVQVMANYAAENPPDEKKPGLFGRNRSRQPQSAPPLDLDAEHPMALNLVPAYIEQVRHTPSILHHRDERGWTQLHHFALGGSAACTQVMLDYGADPRAVTNSGLSAAQLALSLGWTEVVELLQRHGG